MIKRVKTQHNEKNSGLGWFKILFVGLIVSALGVVLRFALFSSHIIRAEESNLENVQTQQMKLQQYTNLTTDNLNLLMGSASVMSGTLSDYNNIPLRFYMNDTEFLDGNKTYWITYQITKMTPTFFSISMAFYNNYVFTNPILTLSYSTYTGAQPYREYYTAFSSTNYRDSNNVKALYEKGLSFTTYYTPTDPVRTGTPILDKDSVSYVLITQLFKLSNESQEIINIRKEEREIGLSLGYENGKREVIGNFNEYGLYNYEQYNKNWQNGYNSAQEGLNFTWFTSIFATIGTILGMKLFGNISLGMIILIPISISMVFFIIKVFRGGD